MGISHKTGIGGFGILGVIQGEKGAGKTVALRADMDALPITEENDLPYKSVNVGAMHACGHDIHTACLLGAAKILNELKSHWSGKIVLVFQPGEEKIPGGAKLMLEDGVFSEHTPDLIIGQHVYPELPAGHVGFRPGQYMASSDEIYITLKGKGGHAALPHKTIDTVLMAAQTVVSLQQVVSRIIPTQVPAVLSFGNIVCNSAMNIIPETIRLEGTFRTMDEQWRYVAHEKIRKIANSVAEGMEGHAEVDIQIGFPSVYNNPGVTEKAIKAATELLGKTQVHALDIRMTAEDFGWFAQKYPACFYRLGVTDTTGPATGLHSPKFIANEKAIQTGMQVMAHLAVDALNKV
ncbi:MAG: M20 family metallopeptidase [Salinivirgaceae bacterium]|nr:M20 family metallopeptidase [Salinivirgaceae bacterium]